MSPSHGFPLWAGLSARFMDLRFSRSQPTDGMVSRFRDTGMGVLCRILGAALLSSSLVLSAGAAGDTLIFSRLGSEEGIPHGGVFSLAEDNTGFIWFGADSNTVGRAIVSPRTDS